MGMRVSFEISEQDLAHFRAAMQKARHAVRDAEEADIVEAAGSLFQQIADSSAPGFVEDRVSRLRAMSEMLADEHWNLPEPARGRVLAALVYFCDPEDLIPDHVPGLGFLDDAIMIELVLRELKHEVEAYQDFLEYRQGYDKSFARGKDPVVRARRLARKRAQLLERIERRKDKDREARPKKSFWLW